MKQLNIENLTTTKVKDIREWLKLFDDIEDCSEHCEVVERYRKKIDELLEVIQIKQDTIDDIMKENGAYRLAIRRWEEANAD